MFSSSRALPLSLMPHDPRRVSSLIVMLLALAAGCAGNARQRDSDDGRACWAVRMADSVIARHPQPAMMERSDGGRLPKWSYSSAFLAQAVAEVGVRSGEAKYVDF